MSVFTKFTKKRKAAFLAALQEGLSIREATRPLAVSRRTVYNYREDDPEFASAWDRAVEDGADKLEAEARRRAFEGIDEPVFWRGQECSYVRKYSDTLLMFLLKGLRPEKCRDNSTNLNLTIDGNKLAEQLEAGRQRLLSTRAAPQPAAVDGEIVEVPDLKVLPAGSGE